MATLLLLLVGAAVPVLLYLYYQRGPSNAGVPHVDIDGAKSAARYVAETGRLIERGYNDYCEKGLPFSIPNLLEPSSPLVVLPMKYLNEVAYAPQSKLSSIEYLAKWTPVMPYMTLMSMFARMGARMLVSPNLCTQWASLSAEYLPVFTKATRSVRANYHPSLRWIAKYVDEDVKAVRKIRGQAAELLRPLAQNLFVMTVASTDQTSMIALWLLFELIDHPESMAEIKAEIIEVQGGEDQVWTRKKLGELRVLDSFMTETMRVHSPVQISPNYETNFQSNHQPRSYETLDSQRRPLPKGTTISFPTYQYTLDAELHQDPSTFDPKRHLRKRNEIDTAKFHCSSTADSLVWGSGLHACPRRFIVQASLKLVFVHLLMNYEFRFPDKGKIRPSPDISAGIMMAPDMDSCMYPTPLPPAAFGAYSTNTNAADLRVLKSK
ncbi:cytochrome P450 [Xylariaceae sp. FL1272]|nr:cytochrome P450 [Xylariaceae sp. FL1272]